MMDDQDCVGTDNYQTGQPNVAEGYQPFIKSQATAEAKRQAMTKSDNVIGKSSIPSSRKIYGGQDVI